MERRVILAIFLTFVVLYAYQALFLAPAKPPPQRRPAAGQTSTPATVESADRPAGAGVAPVPPPAPSPSDTRGGAAAGGVAPVLAAVADREIVVETEVVRAVFVNRGARLRSWQLRHYKDDGGKPVELVPPDLLPAQMRPFELRLDDPEASTRLREGLFTTSPETERLDGTKAPATIAFEYADSSGLHVRKAITFSPRSYDVRFAAEVSVGGRPVNAMIEMGPGLGDVFGRATTSSYAQKAQGIYHRDGSVRRLAGKTLVSEPSHEGVFRFAGIDDHYFLGIAIPDRLARIEYAPVSVPGAAAGAAQVDLVSWGVRVAERPSGVRFFLGPKEFDVLAGVDRELVRAINFGIFSWLAVPLLRALNGINQYVGNYGWSIIILTFLINVAIFPLRHKSVVSMRRLQDLQPEIKSIQERYGKLKATDPGRQKMNQELMDLYRQRGVNPAGGCVPMLLTIPVLFAFYSLLSQAIELRGAPFALWIRDLSTHDPYYVTPILMGATMFWQQKITPSTADPTQQKVFMVMPLMFTFMFLWAPSGLVIYWFVSNILAIAQQYATNALIGPPPRRAAGTDGGTKKEARVRGGDRPRGS